MSGPYILSNDEREFYKNRYNLDWRRRGTIKKRFDKKLKEIEKADVGKFSEDLVLIPEENRTKLIYYLLKSINYEKRTRLIDEVLKESKFEKEYSEKEKKVKEILKKVATKPLTRGESRIFVYPKNELKLKNLNWVKMVLNKIYNSKDFILYRKINQDSDYILKRKNRRYFWWFIYNNDKKIKLKDLILSFEIKMIIEFYRRGLLLSSKYSAKYFIDICKDSVKNKDYDKVSNFKYRIYPFEEPKDYNEIVRINPCYKNYKTSDSMEIRLLLQNLLEGNPKYYPEDYRKSWR